MCVCVCVWTVGDMGRCLYSSSLARALPDMSVCVRACVRACVCIMWMSCQWGDE